MTPQNPVFEQDSGFQELLVRCFESLERGEPVDADQLCGDHPDHAAALLEFLDQQKCFRQALSGFYQQGSPAACAPTISHHRLPSEPAETSDTPESLSESAWSLANLSDAQFPVIFGNYSLLGEIDRGGMGIVFKARHRQLSRIVALKIMRSGEFCNDQERARFRAEAEASAVIHHPNIIPIYEVGDARGLTYFTMAFVDGEDLASVARRDRIPCCDAARLLARIANAVEAAHQHGIIHRDLKPSNILLDRSGEPFLIDFGLAKAMHNNRTLTQAGQILGTPAYMAPEQARGEPLTTASDIYSLGAVLYELVTGQAPFSGPTVIDVLLQVLNHDPAAPRKINSQIPRDLDLIIARAMHKEPAKRYPSAASMEADLRHFLLDEPIDHPRHTLWEVVHLWWRREPVLVSHLCGILAVLLIVVITLTLRGADSSHATWIVSLLSVWGLGSYLLQRISVVDRYQSLAYWSWAAFDVIIYTVLIYVADPPRGLLLIGYPMMIAASGLFYRARFVIFVTSLCILGFVTLLATVDDSLTEKPDFCVIYITGLAVLALCLLAMIRRVRGLADYCAGRR